MLQTLSKINHLHHQISFFRFHRLCSFTSSYSNTKLDFPLPDPNKTTTVKFIETFNLRQSLHYLSYSKKYESYRLISDHPDIKKLEEKVLKILKKNGNDPRKYSIIKSSFKDLDNLDLDSRLALLDLIESKNLSRADTKFCFDFFFRNYFTSILNKKIVYKNYYNRHVFLSQINPKLYLKILLHYSFNYLKHDLLKSERSFLSHYLDTTISHEYDYDVCETITLTHSIFKLNVLANPKLTAKQVDCFLKASDKNKMQIYYSLVKFIRQQDYYDANVLAVFKQMLCDNIDRLESKIVVSVLATFTNFAIIDEELFKLISETLISRNDLRLNDIAKFIWCCAYSDYDLIKNEKLFQYLIKNTRSEIKRIDYKYRTSDAIDIIKSLILLNVYDQDLINYCLRETGAIDDLKTTNLVKPKSDLFFIIRSIEIESPDYFPIELNNVRSLARTTPNSLSIELENRKDFNSFIQFLQNNLDVKFDYEFIYPLPHINSCSIKVTYFKNKVKQTVLMELQDESNTFRNAPDKLKNIFATKLRQLDALNIKYLLFKREGNTFVRV